VEVRRKHARAKEDSHQCLRQSFWGGWQGRRRRSEHEGRRRRGVWRMGISPCTNLVTAASPGQAPLDATPPKHKLTAGKVYGANPALRASVFIME
jgi:hypothetical protein